MNLRIILFLCCVISAQSGDATLTIYKDGIKIQEFTGNKNPNNTRVVLIDEFGKVIFFHDRGFSVKALNIINESI